MSDVGIGFGSDFKRGAASVGEVLSIGAPSLSRDAIDKTHMKSPDGWREFLFGLKDAGEVTVEIQANPGTASYQAMVADFDVKEAQAYTIEFPDGSSWAFTAGITGLETSDPLDDKITATATFKITGKPVLAAGV